MFKILALSFILFLAIVFISGPVSAVDIIKSTSGGIKQAMVGNDTIKLGNGNYGGINNTNMTIASGPNVTITGESKEGAILDGNKNSWPFNVNNNANLALINITFLNGYKNGSGGAISPTYNTIITNSNFINNTTSSSSSSSAIYKRGGIMNIIGSNFINNTATNYAGAIIQRDGVMNVCDSIFTNNAATNYGGAIYQSGTGGFLNGPTFTNNTASYGGAILTYKNLNITSSSFINNNATISSAICNNGTSNINYSIFNKNAGVAVFNNGTSVIITDFNWWGSNNITGKYSSFIVNNYYTMIINSTAINGSLSIGDIIPIKYYFTLNGTNNTDNSNLLPLIIANITKNGVGIYNNEGRINNNFNENILTGITTFNVYFDDTLADSFIFKIKKINTTPNTTKSYGVYNQSIILNVTLKNNNTILAGKFVEVWVNNNLIAIFKTNNNGIDSYTYKVLQTGNLPVEFRFNGDESYNSALVKNTLVVNKFSLIEMNNMAKKQKGKVVLSSVIKNVGSDEITAKMTYKIGKGLILTKISVKNAKYSYNKKTKTVTISFKNLAKGSNKSPEVYFTFKSPKKTKNMFI